MVNDPVSFEECPVCHKPTAPSFMWGDGEDLRMCLVCHQKHTDDVKSGRSNAGTNLKSESKVGRAMLKICGFIFGSIALFVTGVCLFYKPQTKKLIAEMTGKPLEAEKARAGAKPGGTGNVDKKDGKPEDPATDNPDDKSEVAKAGEAKPGDPAADKKAAPGPGIATTSANGKKEKMAPTVQAVISQLPQNTRKQKDVAVPSAVKNLMAGAEKARGEVTGGGSQGGFGKPNEQAKAKAEETKAAALAVASAIIDRNDPDGTKSAEALAKLGSVSTAFAEVATQLTPESAMAPKAGAASSTTAGSTRLEADVLEAQGKAGYDPLEAVRRETDDEPAPTTIRVQLDPDAPKPKPGTQESVDTAKGMLDWGAPKVAAAGGNPNAGMVQTVGTLAMNSLPSTFAKAAGGQGSEVSVVMMDMRGDLLFDFNSAALRPDAAWQLAEVGQRLSSHPDLPVLIRGYTDGRGSPEANLALSKKRAEAVRAWLIGKFGTDPRKMSIQGLGASEPVAPNENNDGTDNPEGREKNRRVSVIIPQVPPGS
jgi:outer membrane protein OmpA-like peptidoglycan-associated protein